MRISAICVRSIQSELDYVMGKGDELLMNKMVLFMEKVEIIRIRS